MTHSDFNQLLSSINGLTPEQMRQLRQQLDKRLSQPKKRPAPAPGKAAKPPRNPLTEAEIQQHMLDIGLMSQLPDTDADYDDPDDQPIEIEGEPLSEMILRERR